MLEVLREIDSSDDVEGLPVIESYEVFTSDTEQPSSEDAIAGLLCFERLELSEVLVDLDRSIFLANGESVCLRGIYCGPDEISTVAKGRVLKLRV